MTDKVFSADPVGSPCGEDELSSREGCNFHLSLESGGERVEPKSGAKE